MIRLLIVDDHSVVRHGLVQIFSSTLDIKVVAEASSGSEALDFVRSQSFDVVILDYNMPGMSGLDTLRHLQAEFPDLPVLMLSMHKEVSFRLRLLRAGAAGFAPKDYPSEALIKAVRRVAQGKRFVPPELADALLDEINSSDDRPLHASLSDREFEVMRLLVKGQTVSQIAETLSLSVKTVSTYRTRLLEKMHMENNAELMLYAFQNELFS